MRKVAFIFLLACCLSFVAQAQVNVAFTVHEVSLNDKTELLNPSKLIEVNKLKKESDIYHMAEVDGVKYGVKFYYTKEKEGKDILHAIRAEYYFDYTGRWRLFAKGRHTQLELNEEYATRQTLQKNGPTGSKVLRVRFNIKVTPK